MIYLNDILIFSKSEEKHHQHLNLIIEHLQQADLYANPKKCEFFKSELEYLRFIINKKNLQMNSACVQIISDWCHHSFKTYQDVQVFLEFCNFYQWFIYEFTGIAQSLHNLLHDMKNDRKPGLIADNWQNLQQEVFEQLINAFISAPVLHHYNSDCKLHMKTDASESACAGILSQKWKNR